MDNIVYFKSNDNGRDFVVGDIHGFYDELNQKLLSVNFNSDVDRLFSVGDLVDRGPRSADALILLSKPWFHAIRGNHEQMAIDWAKGPEGLSEYMYTMNGGAWFIALPKEEQQKFAEAFDQLPYVFEIETPHGVIGVVHAQCQPDDWNTFKDNFESYKYDAIWGRERFYGMRNNQYTTIANIPLVIVGHSPVDGFRQAGNTLFIDTKLKSGNFSFVEINSETIRVH